MTANKATPEELDKIAREAATKSLLYNVNGRQRIIRSAIDQALALAAADLIESQRNAVIEECAKKCDEAGYSNQLQPIENLAEKLAMAGATLQAKKLAIGLRALKTKDDSAVPVERQCES